MARLLVFFLATLLPFHVAWASAASYCQHESRAEATAHFGHHSHVHDGKVAEKANPAAQGSHGDCGTCQVLGASLVQRAASAVPLLSLDTSMVVAPPSIPTSAPPRAPDRPQWLRLV